MKDAKETEKRAKEMKLKEEQLSEANKKKEKEEKDQKGKGKTRNQKDNMRRNREFLRDVRLRLCNNCARLARIVLKVQRLLWSR